MASKSKFKPARVFICETCSKKSITRYNKTRYCSNKCKCAAYNAVTKKLREQAK